MINEHDKLYDDMVKLWSGDVKDIRKHAHWQAGQWTEEKWMEIGDLQFSHLKYFLDTFNVDGINSVMEYGSGGGINARVLCEEFENYFAVDISEATLNHLDEQMIKFGLVNYDLVFYDGRQPEDLLSEPLLKNIDLIISTAVFQHLPNFEYTQRVFNIFNDLLKPGSYIAIQYRDNIGEIFEPKNENYIQNYIRMLSFNDEQIVKQVENANFEVLELKKFGDANNSYKWVFAKKK